MSKPAPMSLMTKLADPPKVELTVDYLVAKLQGTEHALADMVAQRNELRRRLQHIRGFCDTPAARKMA